MRASLLCVSALLFAAAVDAQVQTRRKDSSPSPDGQWEYQCTDGFWSAVVKKETGEQALDLSTEVSAPYCEGSDVVWAPDSKRFVFNYSPPHVPHSSYVVTAFYELRDDKWVALPSPVDPDSDNKTFAALAKHLPKGVRRPPVWATDPVRLIFKVRDWTDPDTAKLYVYAAVSSDSKRSASASALLFTLKFEPGGTWKIVGSEKLSAKEHSESH